MMLESNEKTPQVPSTKLKYQAYFLMISRPIMKVTLWPEESWKAERSSASMVTSLSTSPSGKQAQRRSSLTMQSGLTQCSIRGIGLLPGLNFKWSKK
jgi:hypothetical protein